MKNQCVDKPFADRLCDICWYLGMALSFVWSVFELVGIVPRGSGDLVSRVAGLLFFVLAAVLAYLCGSKGRLVWCVTCAAASLAWCFLL